MSEDQFYLLKRRRFLPLFLTQFMGAFNDNVFKNALVILLTYDLADKVGSDVRLVVTAAAGVFILPFFLFSAFAGQLADKYEKTGLIRRIKFVEILLMILAGLGFWLESFYLLMATLFLMGSQSAFFGPLKYGILPDHLAEDELIAGNGLVEGSTFLAILLGTIAGGLLILGESGRPLVSVMSIAVAAGGFLSSLAMPRARAAAPHLRINPNIFSESYAIVRSASYNRPVFLSILGISWFWFLGATFLSQFPAYTKNILNGDEQAVTLLLCAFSIGIALGSLLCNKLLKGNISPRYVAAAAMGMAVFCADLYLASPPGPAAAGAIPQSLETFVREGRNWRILLDCSLIAIFGGLYIVPLYALLQERSDPARRARMVAANNIMNAFLMVLSALLVMTLLHWGLSIPEIFLVLGGGTFLVALGLHHSFRAISL
ncbi:MFS transporter [Luteithermobacter gelatinilyticus]|uniref:MFS transporter n=1 Tax=Luteithermobacter gelatinilyticus TaxID=2582913 RepID=UPI0011063917|nr:MFS transporter [Luteithermobacter gelatinilyticus]